MVHLLFPAGPNPATKPQTPSERQCCFIWNVNPKAPEKGLQWDGGRYNRQCGVVGQGTFGSTSLTACRQPGPQGCTRAGRGQQCLGPALTQSRDSTSCQGVAQGLAECRSTQVSAETTLGDGSCDLVPNQSLHAIAAATPTERHQVTYAGATVLQTEPTQGLGQSFSALKATGECVLKQDEDSWWPRQLGMVLLQHFPVSGCPMLPLTPHSLSHLWGWSMPHYRSPPLAHSLCPTRALLQSPFHYQSAGSTVMEMEICSRTTKRVF